MRIIDYANAFKRDFKRELKGRYVKLINTELKFIVEQLANDIKLDAKYYNHKLSGNWNGYEECCIKPDFLLIYKKVDLNILLLARIGSHSELFN